MFPPRTPSRNENSGVSSGAYKPGYKPPPIPINSPSPGSPGSFNNTNNSNNVSGSPISPGRPSTASPRPSLPFLEKYAQKKKSSASPPVPNNNSNGNSNGNSTNGQNTLTGSPLSVSPTTPTAPSYDRQGLTNGSGNGTANGHYQREQNDYFPKSGSDSRSRTPLDDHRYPSSSSAANIPSRSKTPDSSSQFSTSPSSARASQQPALPQKSNARSPSIASAQGLGINGIDMNGRIKSPTMNGGYDGHGRSVDPRDRDPRDQRSQQQQGDYGSSPPSISNGFNRSGSSGSTASSVLAERGFQRERSNTVLSERSERSARSVRSERSEKTSEKDRRYPEEERGDRDRSTRDRERERSERERGDRDRERLDRDRYNQLTPSTSRSNGRHQDGSSAYKTPSPPVSPEGTRASEMMSNGIKNSGYRPPTPPEASSPVPTRGRRPSVAAPTRKASGDQFDALMDDLIQEINVMPAASRDSTRPTSSHRSRSRPNLPESGSSRSQRDLLAGSPPPTPGLPKLNSGSDSIRSYRSNREHRDDRDRERSDRDRSDRGDRTDRTDREREREHRSDRERTDRDRSDRDRSDRDRERRSERDRERSDRDRSDRAGDREGRERERERERTTGRSSTRSRSTNRRGGIQHCEGCKHDIQPHEASAVIKMSQGDYHPECFNCARCRRPIESPRQAHEYEGRLLCEKDYNRVLEKEALRANGGSTEKGSSSSRSRTTVMCAGCDAPIRDETPVYALGLSWHERHLQCHHCKKPIQSSVGHVEKNNRVYCPKDFGELFLPKCRACGLPVEKEAVCAQDGKLEGKWHAACFGCQTCKKPFPDKSFYVYGDAPYCRRHYHKLNNSLCKSCDQPIEGPCAQTMEGWRFHPGCFSCVECKTPLTDIYYNFENQAYCEKDIMVIQRTRNVRAERRKTFFGKV
ncbi:hypothetical protein BGZ83_004901 [Gryganskiella cystojenkinii]|nr:hypothetical protein BGZ83_004901 [Gryganskiella cystojenkinii]